MERCLMISPLLIALMGCASINPLISNINIIPIKDEVTLGEQMAAQVSKDLKIVQNASTEKRVQILGEKLVRQLPLQPFTYHFHIVEDKTPNAFAIPGGHIFVHTGLLTFAANDNELAGVLAHEIGHVYERHPTKALTRLYGVEYLTRLIFNKNPTQLQNLGVQLTKGTVLSKYGRDDEREADIISYQLTKRAGFSTSGLLTFLTRLQKYEQGAMPPVFLRTHPPTIERIGYLKSLEMNGQAEPG